MKKDILIKIFGVTVFMIVIIGLFCLDHFSKQEVTDSSFTIKIGDTALVLN